MNNDPYNHTILYNGRRYRYDPDYDCFYAVYTKDDVTAWDRWGWLAVIVSR